MRHRFAAALCVAIVVLLTVASAALAIGPFGTLAAFQQKMSSGDVAGLVDQGRFIVVRYDDDGRVSYQVCALHHAPPAGPLVVILGGSAVRECVTSDGSLAAGLSDRYGKQVTVLSLASSVQRLGSAVSIIDNLPDHIGGVVVIGVHELTFGGSSADVRAQLTGVPIMATSRALHDFAAARFGGHPPNTMYEGIRRYLAYYARMRGVPAFQGAERDYQRHRYDRRGCLPWGTKLAMVSQFRANVGAPGGPFFTYFDLNRALLRRCVTLARSKGYQVLFMEDPQDTAAVGHAFDVYKQKYRPACAALVKTEGAHYSDLNRVASLVNGDFYDITHLLASGRGKWTPRLEAVVAQILRDHRLHTVKVTLSDPAPPQGRVETARCTVLDRSGQPIRAAEVTFTWNFESTIAESIAQTDGAGHADSTTTLPAMTPGTVVTVDVSATFGGDEVTGSTTFTLP